MYLFDYSHNKVDVPVNIKDDDIINAFITVISGDEVLTVTYADNSTRRFDSSMNRSLNYFDCEYKLKVDGELIPTYHNWLNRTDSYDFSFLQYIDR